MSRYAEGFRVAISCARQLGVHWTEDERNETRQRAIVDQERLRRNHPDEEGEIVEQSGFIAGLNSHLTSPREDGHNWNPARPGASCQTCLEGDEA